MRIVIVEDNPGDVLLFREALTFGGIDAEVTHFADGLAAVTALEAENEGWRPRPDIVFLDLNMPRLSGFEVLKILRESSHGADTRVVVFTSSQAPADMAKASELGADRFLRKPTELRSFFEVISSTVRELA
jgi:two-component system, chemotaxis family, response regulator Rcp1